MPVYEFKCKSCQLEFEILLRLDERDTPPPCIKCQSKDTQRIISRFAVAGRGDLRESTLHGCHDAHVHSSGCGHGHSHDPD